MALTTIAHYRDVTSAHIARARLEAEGIPAFVSDEYLVGMHWLYSDAVGGVKLQVPTPFADEARAVVEEDHSPALRGGAARSPSTTAWPAGRCPRCDGDDVETTYRSRSFEGKPRASEGSPESQTATAPEASRPALTLHERRHRCGSCQHQW